MLYLYHYLIERRMHAAVESIYNSFDSITQMALLKIGNDSESVTNFW